ncbi:uncharacterized protein MONBRDRAFT_27656 [Monosiga brevicollis MX1]|uniref:Calx-beta domain-containing protein n=1 Tax=Monosiga brevicollis TaxID=81824 RepID=A9V5Y0_MONBE|nr:uncharacterized protein MONBRDRAFT_27656 [Monosiga brevicollis MX1]EDQ87127.1 predicted protein [Monosiga brevicollis MX1]|eukprot:XP_001748070.1 hypothetical protein [Monosiga brevicollis MX1]
MRNPALAARLQGRLSIVLWCLSLQAALFAGPAVSSAGTTIAWDNCSAPLLVTEPSSGHHEVGLSVSRSGPGNETETVWWQVVDAPHAVNDVASTSGSVIFAPGQLMATVTLAVLADAEPEMTELLQLELLNSSLPGSSLGTACNVRSVFILPNGYSQGVLVLDPSGLYRGQESRGAAAVISVPVYRYGGATTLAGAALRVVNGSADFVFVAPTFALPAGTNSTVVSLYVRDDDLPEDEERFELRLESGVDVLIDPLLNQATALIAASDGAYGTFGFATSQTVVGSEPESVAEAAARPINLAVNRTGGVYRDIALAWSLRALSDNVNASAQFVHTSGTLVVPHGARNSTLQLWIQPDDVPETLQQFEVNLESASTGAELDVTRRHARVDILGNDDGIAIDMPEPALEESGWINLTVVRTGLLASPAVVAFSTHAGSAEPYLDYVAVSGNLTFAPNVSSQPLAIRLIDDPVLEPSEFFQLHMTVLTGEVVLITTRLNLTIAPSDGAAGVLGFVERNSLTLAEGQGVVLNVSRRIVAASSNVGAISVRWRLDRADGQAVQSSDWVQVAGELNFADGVDQARLLLQSLNDSLPELDTEYSLVLHSASPPAVLGSVARRSLLITIPANDDPFGTLVLHAGPSLQVSDSARFLTINVTRSNHSRGDIGLWARWARNGEVLAIVGPLVLPEAQAAPLQVQPALAARHRLVPADHLELTIINVTVVGVYAGSPAAIRFPPRFAEATASSFYPLIPETAVAGTIQFALMSRAVNVREIEGVDVPVQLRVERVNGTFTSVTLPFTVSGNKGEDASSDMMPTNGFLTFGPGQRMALLNLSLIGDAEPELEEILTVQLSPIQGGQAFLGSDNSSTIVVAPSDAPYGQFELSAAVPATRTLAEGEAMDLIVFRQAGAFGDVVVGLDFEPVEAAARFAVTPRQLAFEAGGATAASRQGRFALVRMDDDVPNPTEVVVVTLRINATAGPSADLGTHVGVTVTTPRADNSSGVFRFADSVLAVTTVDEAVDSNTSVALNVARDGGHFGTVLLPWVLVQCPNTDATQCAVDAFGDAVNDFAATSGVLRVEDGATAADLSLVVLHDRVPEDNELFRVTLFDASTDPEAGRVGVRRHAFILVPSNDPLLAFDTLRMEVREEIGQFAVPIVRTGNTAQNLPLNLSLPASAPLRLVDGAPFVLPSNVTRINATFAIDDNSFPEPRREVLVSLFPSMGFDYMVDPLADVVVVAVAASDGIGGSFALVNASASATQPQVLSESDTMNVTIRRSGPAFGDVMVAWQVADNCTSDVAPTSGQVLFAENQTAANISFVILADGVPELAEKCTVSLKTAIPADIQYASVNLDTTGMVFEISASDHPHGVFGVMSTVLNVTEGRLLSVPIARFYGAFGAIRVQYRLEPLQNAIIAEHFSAAEGALVFEEGEVQKDFTLLAVDDAVPELAASFLLVLEADPPAQVAENASSVQLDVAESDEPHGRFVLEPRSLNLTEGQIFNLTILREQGAYGAVSVEVSWQSCLTSVPLIPCRLQNLSVGSEDISPLTTTIHFEEGERVREITFSVLDDSEPELWQLHELRLSAEGAAVASDRATSQIAIAANDAPFGTFSLHFLQGAQAGRVAEGAFVQLVIERTSFLAGAVSVQLAVTYGTADAEDLASFPTSFDFGPTEAFKTVTVQIVDDEIPEDEEFFQIHLDALAPSGLSRLDTQHQAVNVSILPSDDPFGVFGFSNASLDLVVQEGVRVPLVIERTRGTFRTAYLGWQFRASADTVLGDFDRFSGTVIIPAGEARAEVNLSTIQDDVPELSEDFVVEIYVGNLGTGEAVTLGPDAATTITIAGNGDPYGYFQLRRETVYVDEPKSSEAPTVVQAWVDRVGGAFGEVALWLGHATSSTVDVGADVTANWTQPVVFAPNQTSAAFRVAVWPDDEPEVGERLVLIITNATLLSSALDEVHNPQPRINVLRNTSVVIRENDDARGVLQFSDNTPLIIPGTEGSVVALNVSRHAGAFGEVNISLAAVIPGACNFELCAIPGRDFDILSITATLAANQRWVLVNVSLLEDSEPELAEMAFVLLGLGAGSQARLGTRTLQQIEIAASDDPYGRFGHASTEALLVHEDADGSRQLELLVRREGGTRGTTHVDWVLRTHDQLDLPGNLAPHAGTLIFPAAGAESMVLRLNVTDDSLPSLYNNVSVQLLAVHGGGRLTPGRVNRTVTLLESDAPHGALCFEEDSIVYHPPSSERKEAGQVLLTVLRQGGLFGELQVTVRVSAPVAQTLAPWLNASQKAGVVADVFTLLSEATLDADASGSMGPSLLNTFNLESEWACPWACLEFTGCMAAVVLRNLGVCELYGNVSQATAPVVALATAQLYVLKHEGSQALASRVALPGADLVAELTVLVPADTSTVPIALTVFEDALPELSEFALVEMVDVVLLDDFVQPMAPVLCEGASVLVELGANDFPRGLLSIEADRSELTEGGAAAVVTVLRKEGWYGDQLLYLTVDEAHRDDVMVPSSVALMEGQSQVTFRVTALDDDIPELDEEIGLSVSQVDGGAILTNATTLSFKILGNDLAAGTFQWAISEAQVSEPLTAEAITQLDVPILRTGLQAGMVEVDWMLDMMMSARTILPTSGTVSFGAEQTVAYVRLELHNDLVAQLAEQVSIRLQNLSTSAATLSAVGTEASIHVASDQNVYGSFAFADASTVVEEVIGPLPFAIQRSGGLFGRVLVLVSAIGGTATPNVDFVAEQFEIYFEEGQRVEFVNVTLINDDIPELAEDFSLVIDQVTLVDETYPPSNTTPAASATPLGITIDVNDDANGVFGFVSAGLVETTEGAVVSLQVSRSAGTFGTTNIPVTLSVAGQENPATLASDVQLHTTSHSPLFFFATSITFSEGAVLMTINLTILDDQIPEFAETFVIQLGPPSHGVLGTRAQVLVRIAESGYPRGLLHFENTANQTITEDETRNSSLPIAISRAPGRLTNVLVVCEVERLEANGELSSASDVTISPPSLVLRENEVLGEFVVTVWADQIPEVATYYRLSLRSADAPVAAEGSHIWVLVPSNDDAHGIFHLSASEVILNETGIPASWVITRAGILDQAQLVRLGDNMNSLIIEALPTRGATSVSICGRRMLWTDARQNIAQMTTIGGLVLHNFSTDGTPTWLCAGSLAALVDRGDTRMIVLETGAVAGALGTPVDHVFVFNQSIFVLSSSEVDGLRVGKLSESFQVEWLMGRLCAELIHPTVSHLVTRPSEILLQCHGIASLHRVWLADNRTDIPLTGGTIRFAPDQATATITLPIVDDDTPELAEAFNISLRAASGGARVATSNASTEFEVAASDAWAGAFSLVASDLERIVAEEDSGPSLVVYHVFREQGALVEAVVTWHVEPANTSDFAQTQGQLVFPRGVAEATFVLTVLSDEMPEGAEHFRISISVLTPLLGAEVRQGTGQLTVAGNDGAYGTVDYILQSHHQDQTLREGDEVQVLLLRSGPLDRILVARMVAVALNGSAFDSATDLDCGLVDGVVVLPASVANVSVTCTVTADGIPEETEAFALAVTEVDVANRLAWDDPTSPRLAPTAAALHFRIAANDNASGVLAFDVGLAAVLNVSEAYNETTFLRLPVHRTAGAFGHIAVPFTFSNVSTSVLYAQSPSPLSFADGERTRDIILAVPADHLPEAAALVHVHLGQPTGGFADSPPLLAADPRTIERTIHVAESDAYRGAFRLSLDHESTAVRGGQSLNLTIHRDAGTFGMLTLQLTTVPLSVYPWTLTQGSGLSPERLNVTFVDGQSMQEVQFHVHDDGLPEVDECYALVLSVADAAGIPVGWSFNLSHSRVEVCVAPSDDANGVFGFETTHIDVVEPSLGTVPVLLNVTRRGGAFGSVSLGWHVYLCDASSDADQTTGCARSQATREDLGTDTELSGQLSFAENETSHLIELTIRADARVEGAERFTVELTLRSSVVEGGLAFSRTNATVLIAASNFGNGIVTVSPASASVVVAEGTARVLGLRRSAGFGRVVCALELTAMDTESESLNASRFLFTPSQLVLEDGQLEASTTLLVADDDVPELESTWVFATRVVAGGAVLGRSSHINVTIPANDDPYGVFNLTSAVLSTVHIRERRRLLSGTIQRLAGLSGAVDVKVQFTLESTLPDAAARAADWTNCSTCWISFEEGRASLSFANLVLPLARLYRGDRLHVQLRPVRRANGAALPVLGTGVILTATALDSNLGLQVGFETAATREGETTRLRVDRLGVVGGLQAQLASAAIPRELSVPSLLVTLANNVDVVVVDVAVLADGVPELNESVSVELSDIVATGDDLVVFSSSAAITILANDNPGGRFGFSQTVLSAAEGKQVELTIVREDGALLDMVADLVWPAELLSQLLDTGIPSRMALAFPSGEDRVTIAFTVAADGVPEEAASFDLILALNQSSDLAVVNADLGSCRVDVPASDDPYGRVGFSSPELTVSEDDGQRALVIRRSGGLLRDVGISVVVVAFDGSNPDSGSGQPDFQIVPQHVEFAAGQREAAVLLVLRPDDEPEDAEMLTLELTSAENGVNINASAATMQVTIAANDRAYGEFTIFGADGTCDEGGTAAFEVRRAGGLFGTVVLDWSVVAQSARQSDLAPSSGNLTFGSGQATATLQLLCVDDLEPEVDERFAVQITVSMTGAPGTIALSGGRANGLIRANDVPAGRLAFACLDRLRLADTRFNNTLTLTVERIGGALLPIEASVRVSTAGAVAAERVAPLPPSLTLGVGVTSASLRVHIQTGTAGQVTIKLGSDAIATILLYPDEAARGALQDLAGSYCAASEGGGLGDDDAQALPQPSHALRTVELEGYATALSLLVAQVAEASATELAVVHAEVARIVDVVLAARLVSSASTAGIIAALESYTRARLARLNATACGTSTAEECQQPMPWRLMAAPADMWVHLFLTVPLFSQRLTLCS